MTESETNDRAGRGRSVGVRSSRGPSVVWVRLLAVAATAGAVAVAGLVLGAASAPGWDNYWVVAAVLTAWPALALWVALVAVLVTTGRRGGRALVLMLAPPALVLTSVLLGLAHVPLLVRMNANAAELESVRTADPSALGAQGTIASFRTDGVSDAAGCRWFTVEATNPAGSAAGLMHCGGRSPQDAAAAEGVAFYGAHTSVTTNLPGMAGKDDGLVILKSFSARPVAGGFGEDGWYEFTTGDWTG